MQQILRAVEPRLWRRRGCGHVCGEHVLQPSPRPGPGGGHCVMLIIIVFFLSCLNVLPVVVYQRVESLDDLLVLAEGEKRVLGAPLPDLMADQSEASIYSDQSQLTW